MTTDKPLVSIITLAYNHSKYIRQCLDGFIMQKTDFPFEVIIHDDASTDGTADIIREYEKKYPGIIKPVYQTENQYSRKIAIGRTYLYPKAEGEYIAECEGDDYWNDPYKLQKQVDYMRSHQECSMCFTSQGTFFQDSRTYVPGTEEGFRIFTFRDFLKRNYVGTLTSLSKASLVKEFQFEIAPRLPYFPMGDYPMWFYLVRKGPVVRLEGETGVYRILSSSASHYRDSFEQLKFAMASFDIRIYFNKLLGVNRPFMTYMKWKDTRKFCWHWTKETKESFLKLYFRCIKYMLKNPPPIPDKETTAIAERLIKSHK